MGTYTSYVVDVIGLPPEASAKVVHVLEEEYRLLCHTIDPDASRPEWAAHGPDLVFENAGADTGQAEEIALALHKIAETAIHPFVFEVVEEAAEDWPGSRYIYIPWFGLWADAVGDSTYVATSKLQELLDGPRRTSARSSKGHRPALARGPHQAPRRVGQLRPPAPAVHWTELLDTIARFHTAEALNRHAQRLAVSQPAR